MSSVPELVAKKKRVLIVDDSSTVRVVLRRWLHASGFETVECSSGEQALRVLSGSTFDMITMDVDMPGMNGFEACEQLRAEEAVKKKTPIPVIFVTSHDTFADRKRGYDCGAADFLPKPPQESDFLARVNRLLKPQDRFAGLRALVAEDSYVTRQIICQSLRELGLEVVEAENGEVAYKILQSRTHGIDIVVTDYDMPVMDGKQLCVNIRTTLGLRWMPVIFLTGLGEMSYVIDIFACGASDYITKPFTKEEVLARISVHLEILKLDMERSRSIKQLEQLNRLKDKVLAVASHDLRSPLNGIIGYTHLMLMDDELSAEYRDYVSGIQESGNWLLSIVDDLLDLAHTENKEREVVLSPTDLVDVVKSSLRVMSRMAAEKQINLQLEGVDADQGTVTIMAERRSLQRMLNNLLSNAIKFTKNSGKVSVRLGCSSQHILLSVEDNGIGIPKDKLAKLFDRFTPSSRPGTMGEKSTGLGMSIVKELAEQHGGSVEVTSAEGVGSVFTVRFPLVTEHTA